MKKNLNFINLTLGYQKLLNCKNHMEQHAKYIESDFNLEPESFFLNPFAYQIPNYMENALYELKKNSISFIINQFKKSDRRYEYLIIDENEVLKEFKAVSLRGKGVFEFNASDVLNYLKNEYADIEIILFNQIIKSAKEVLPYIREDDRGYCGYAEKLSHIEFFGKHKTGIVLRVYCGGNTGGLPSVTSVLKLIEIVVGEVQPSDTMHVNVYTGMSYVGIHYKSAKVFKNDKLKVVFNNNEDAEKFLKVLLAPID